MVTGNMAAIGVYARDVSAVRGEAGHVRMLQQAPAVILHRPCVSLQRPVRIGVAAKMIEVSTEDIVARERHEFADLCGIEDVGAQAMERAVIERPAIQQELMLVERDT